MFKKECIWLIRIFGFFSVLFFLSNVINWVIFMLVIGGCLEIVLVCVFFVMVGLEIMFWVYFLVIRIAYFFFSLVVRLSYVFSVWFLEWRKVVVSDFLRVFVVSLLKKNRIKK